MTTPSIKPLLTAEQIQTRVAELGRLISLDHAGKELLAISAMKGAFMFFSDLIRFLDIPVKVDFVGASSYSGTETTGAVKIYQNLTEQVTGKHVLLVDDIIDTGVTLDRLRSELLSRQPACLKICTLLDKPSRRRVPVPVDYVGFEVPDLFIVGYGIDYNGMFRQLPYVAVLVD
ncbi:MAG: hypoxanthine phosphoribosyltransferase [Nitrospiraceae bacterium]|jgi:hypoxanthine phosphoribosyltransferase|nr:hypoxanthine phosphoribosyltransferase [Nitrospiraceae bacterium]